MSDSNGMPIVGGIQPLSLDEIVVIDTFNRNHDPQDLVRYHGQWVAWSRDGRKVLFAAPDPYKLCDMVDAAGLTTDQYVLAGLDAPWS